VAWSPDGKLLASTADSSGVILWEAATGKEVRRLPGGSKFTVAFTRGGKELVVGSYSGVERWETATGKRLGMSLRGKA
jgi:WD40 repeat protein